jgi:signal transduction histidine kinase
LPARASARDGHTQRQRLERDLHDGAQQRLVSLALTLRMARERLDRDPSETGRPLERSHAELEEALTELRELARGIHPAILTDRGIAGVLVVEVGRRRRRRGRPRARQRTQRPRRTTVRASIPCTGPS